MEYTLTYSEAVKGWVSFYSYYPDWMIGMNSYFYTFKGGNLYRHNVNNTRNQFYLPWWTEKGDPAGSFVATQLQSVFNTAPLENKLFKTIILEGDSSWEVDSLITDLQYSGYIYSNWFEKKESTYFAFVRNNSTGQMDLRSMNGIGNSLLVENIDLQYVRVKFSINPLVSVGEIVSVGDILYWVSGSAPVVAGKITTITVDYPAGKNELVIDTFIPNAFPIPTDTEFMMYVKDSVAESHGVLGHYCTFTIRNLYGNKIELFTVGSDVMKSYP
jgi:hypothetical protein